MRHFVNSGKKIEPKLISRIQDRRGKTIFQGKNQRYHALVAINSLMIKLSYPKLKVQVKMLLAKKPLIK